MAEKRYAIVRAEYDSCPIKYKVPQKHRKIKCFPFECDKCGLYGDTKEQLIRKVQTTLQLCNKNRVEKCNQFYFVAKEIVEFLGVEE